MCVKLKLFLLQLIDYKAKYNKNLQTIDKKYKKIYSSEGKQPKCCGENSAL